VLAVRASPLLEVHSLITLKMKVQDLIAELQKFPTDTEVCVADWRKNIHHADDEPQGHGIEPKFKVEFVNEDVNIPFVALSFENDDYKDDGTPDEGSSIYPSIQRGVS
jgi:hypothetical protein